MMMMLIKNSLFINRKLLFSFRYGSMEKPVKTTVGINYKNQPGKIENYTPGNSSISDKEAEQVILCIHLE
jgi:hypothetical protein